MVKLTGAFLDSTHRIRFWQMPKIQAFRGLRYDMGHVGSLSDVIAPPYDVIDSDLQDELYKRHPTNVIRLILNRDEPGDEEGARYERAARYLRNWSREGVLQTEGDPAIYVYHQQFDYDEHTYTRRGFMCRVRLEPFGSGNIFPHEETHAAAKADRLLLTKACQANLSQIFGIYPDADNKVQNALEAQIEGVQPIEAVDHLSVIHRLWPVFDVRAIGEASTLIANQPMFVADGHHRYETACNYREYLRAEGKLTDDNHPANFVMTMCVSMNDPGMIVLPTHRLFRGVPALDSHTLQRKLEGSFATRVAGEGVDLANMMWSQIEMDNDQGQLAFYCRRDQRWLVCNIAEQGRARLAEIANDRSEEWRSLGVSLLHRLVMETLLGHTDLPKPKYVHLVDEVVDVLAADDGEFELAALVMPATLDDIQAVSLNQERMPAKSTYFYPKLLSGLVINPLQ
jgi:uncharacterized protein (DUF1015 family)